MNAIYVLWVREITKYWRSKARIIGSLGQPILFLLAFGYGFGPVFAGAGEGNYITFLAPGIIGMAIIFSAMFAGIGVIWDRQFGFLKETLVAPVSRSSIAIGRTLGGATISMFQGIIVFLISLLIGFRPHLTLGSALLALLAMLIISILFTAIGTAIAVRMRDMQAFPLVMNFIMMPLFFLSGSLFPMQGLGKGLTAVIKFNPLSYGMDLLRGLFTGTFHFSSGFDFFIIAAVTVVFLVIATLLFKGIEV